MGSALRVASYVINEIIHASRAPFFPSTFHGVRRLSFPTRRKLADGSSARSSGCIDNECTSRGNSDAVSFEFSGGTAHGFHRKLTRTALATAQTLRGLETGARCINDALLGCSIGLAERVHKFVYKSHRSSREVTARINFALAARTRDPSRPPPARA